ncbi:MAG TPA: dodecin flavoprotein [Flavobacteriales bacterium]|jgi:flavin-binding protein dodecin|nr:dodecin flavoprotein [Flavobacteriales bacterium]
MYKMIQVVGTSPKSMSQAIENAIENLGETAYWFEVVEQRGAIAENKVKEFQVKINVGVKMD